MTANTTNSQAARTEDLAKEWAELHMTLEDWRNRAISAESRLAEIQRGMEGLQRYDQGWDGIERDYDGSFIDRDEVLALLQPQFQADTSGLAG